MRKERKMRGFTLVELLIVLLILGILIGLAVPRYLAALEKSRETTFCSNVRSIVSAIETYRMNEGTQKYPATFSDLNNDIINNANYFSQAPVNPYTNATLTASALTPAGTASGWFGYTATEIGLKYEVKTVPDCGIR